MKIIITVLILVLSLSIIVFSGKETQLTNKEMVELFLAYVIETQQEAIVLEMIEATPVTAPIYHILLRDLKERQNEGSRLWRQIEKIKELKEEAKEQKAREDRVRNGEYHKDIFYEPIDLNLLKQRKKRRK